MSVMSILFSDTYDNRLNELTGIRTMASLPYGGRYRIIDFMLSALVSVDISDVGIITKSNYRSLMDHLGPGKEWDLNRKNKGITILPPNMWGNGGAYRGKFEALTGVRNYIYSINKKYVLLCDCNIIASLDLKGLIDFHIEKEADITLIYNTFPAAEGSLLVTVGDGGAISEASVCLQCQTTEKTAALGVYLIEKSLLLDLIDQAYTYGYYNLERDFIGRNIGKLKIYAFEQKSYSATINNVIDYYEASMALLKTDVRNELFYSHYKIYTKVKDTIPTIYMEDSLAANSLIADGCLIEGTVENSIIFRGVHIKKGAIVKNSIIMQDTIVENGAQLSYVITDKKVTVSEGRLLMGYSSYPVVISKGSRA